MEPEPTTITLSQHGAELLRTIRYRHPEMSPAEIIEEALSASIGREPEAAELGRVPEDVRVWLDELASLSDRIAARPGETFSRDMIYQDHD